MKPLPRLKCKGPECLGCSASNCYFEGGPVDEIEREERLLKHHSDRAKKGSHTEGGSISSWTKREDNERGINKVHSGGESKIGNLHRRLEDPKDSHGIIKQKHHEVLSEMKSMKKPHGEFAHGGEVDEKAPHDEAMEMKDILGDQDPVLDMIGDEFLKAIESKNKKELLDSIVAMVLTTK